ncbi:MAG: cobalamin-binding protein [Chloroflexi bacterium]|nr:MAG: cobalamin-binding protein [Chloroflexota bacterium]
MSVDDLYDAIIDGDKNNAAVQTQQALDADISPEAILHETCIPAMSEVGDLFEASEIFIPEMLIAARAMQSVMDILKPRLIADGIDVVGSIVMGTVRGDMHDIGKNLVIMMLEGAGFEVIDLGIDVPPEAFVEAVRKHKPDLLGMSALLTTTMTEIGNTVAALTEAGLRDATKILIGGAPVTKEYADKIGVEGFAEDASRAARIAKELLAIA